MTLSNDDKKYLRGIGHGLKPIVTVAGNGLSENVLAELNRALDDHELIKVKFVFEDRNDKKAVMADLCAQTHADLIQTIGHVALICRRAAKPNPKLSNLMRIQ
jgi:RNA-binding protein